MSVQKLELKHVAPYLPYELKVTIDEGYFFWPYTLESIDINGDVFTEHGDHNLCDIKPILHPLSDLTKEIEHNCEVFIPADRLCEELLYDLFILKNQDGVISLLFPDGIPNVLIAIAGEIVDECSYGVVRKLYEWHFDVAGLIDAGLAIDINTLK